MRTTSGKVIWKSGTSLVTVLEVIGAAVNALGGSPPEFFHPKYVQDFGLSDELLQTIHPEGGFKWDYTIPGYSEGLRFGFIMAKNCGGVLKELWTSGASVMSCYTQEEFTEALLYYKLMKSLVEPLDADYIYGCAEKRHRVENPWDEHEIIRASFLFRRHGWIKLVWHLEHEQVIDGDLPYEDRKPNFIYRHMDTGEAFESDDECPARVLGDAPERTV
jgi:hypothetical protein